MKILMTSDTYLPSLGGGEYHVYYIKRELERLGHRIRLVTFQEGTDDEQGTVRRMPYHGWRSLPAALLLLWRNAGDVDLIHAHYSFRLTFLAATVAFLRRKPLVVTQHGLGLLPQPGAPFLHRLAFNLWRWWSMTVARTVISTSDDLSIDIRALGFGHKIVSIPNGYDAVRFTLLPPPEEPDPILLTVRRLVPKTGIQYLIAALPSLRKIHPNLTCLCVGEGRLRDALRQYAEHLGVADALQFVGAVAHEGLLDYYRQAHVVVFPSTAESTSLACIEAMALGKVIVASRVGGLVELLGANEERGYLVPLTDSEHCTYDAPMNIAPEKIALLADAINRALSHREEALSKGKSAATYVTSYYAWDILAKRTVKEAYLTV